MRLPLVLLLLLPGSLFAQPRKEPLVDQVKASIDRGVKFLRQSQRAEGSWEVDIEGQDYNGGRTALGIVALLNAGVPVSDPDVARALNYLRNVKSEKTYVRALQAIALAEANLPEDRQRVLGHVQWLLDARIFDENKKFLGWTYTRVPGGGFRSTDNSNTQYAVLGLWSAKQAGIDFNPNVWRDIRDYYLATQSPEGGFRYAPFANIRFVDHPKLTMVVAGLSGLLISGMELNDGREEFLPTGAARNCGEYKDNDPAQKAINWIIRHFNIESSPQTFYHLYGLERAGRLTGMRFLGPYDWYREGCEYLVRRQKDDGSWQADTAWDKWPVVSTSFALLFLSKGRTPVLVSKLVHGDWPRREGDNDWNNDRNDLKHLVAFSSKQIFQNQPLAWQSFDIMRTASPRGDRANPTEDDLDDVVSDMLQAPILYITGHKNPAGRFTATEKILLKRYVDQGGFLIAEACCAKPEFDRGFKALVAELWPDRELEPLDAFHPVWTSFHTVKPGPHLPLMGLTGNCKTILIYSPVDLSCRWESNRLTEPAVLEAFRLGNNLIAYATGLEPPRPRLTKMPVASTRGDPASIPRGYFKVAQVKIPGETRPAPRAMRSLMEFINREPGIDVALKTDDRFLSDPSLVDYKFIYMHGRGGFQFDDEAMEKLRFNLSHGGLLFADACCGREPFDKSFRAFIENQLFPGKKLQPVPEGDLLFSKTLNGLALNRDVLRCRMTSGGNMASAEPMLEGIKVQDRWVVLYSKYDIGCALEGHKALDCRGYDQRSAQLLGRAAILYTLWP